MSRVPQFPQKSAPGTIGAAQVGQPIRAPQRTQNFASTWFSAAQFEQITVLGLYRSGRSCAAAHHSSRRG
jgi:hypothetical protein